MNDQKNRTPGSIGGENLVRLAASAALLSLAACGGGSDWDESSQDLDNLQQIPDVGAALSGEIAANTDVAETRAGSSIIVSVLQNDSLTSDAQFQLVGQPANGSAKILSSGAVEYTANADFEGTDVVEYVIVAANGDRSYGKLYVAVVCAECNVPDYANVDTNGFPYCLAENPDPDGDGYGWENNESCVAPEPGAALHPLSAKADMVEINAGDIKTVTPLRNDSIADRATTTFSIDTAPSAGRIEAAEAGVIVYAAPENYAGSDSLVYRITNKDGDTSVASVEFNISCDSCIDYKGVRLTWDSNPQAEEVEGYKVLFGSDENPLTSTEISDVKVADGDSPNVVFDLAADLNLGSNEGGCFMIQAYRGSEISEASDAACFNKGS